jgi:hypothetical protein
MLQCCKLIEEIDVKRLVSVMLFIAVTFLVFHDQMNLVYNDTDSLSQTCNASCEVFTKIDLHEQLHSYTISFDADTIDFTEFSYSLISTNLNQSYDFITFNPPYRPPSA